MLLYITVLSALALAHCRFLDEGNQIQPRGSRIVGGTDASIKDFPHQISLRVDGEHICGGSIYKSNIIITAAHCVKGFNCEQLSVAAGSTYWAKPQQLAYINKCIVHENYNSNTIDYDIAILVLDRHLNFTENVQPIPLADQIPAPGTQVIVTGWGLTEGGRHPDNLKKVEVELISHSKCQEARPPQYVNEGFLRSITDRMLCAGVEAGGKDACRQDSGGPLINAVNRELLGVVSWGDDCDRTVNPGVYASVPNLYDWIVETVRNNDG